MQVGRGQVFTQPVIELKIRLIYSTAAALAWAKISFFWQNFLILQLKKPKHLIAEKGKEKVTRKGEKKENN